MPLKLLIHGWHCQVLLQVGNIVVPSLPWSPHNFIKFSVLALEIFLKAVTWEKRRPFPSSQAIFSVQALSFSEVSLFTSWSLWWEDSCPRVTWCTEGGLLLMILMSLTILNALLRVLCYSQFCLDAFPHGAARCLFLFTELLAFSHRRSECLWWEITVKQSHHSALKCPLPYKVGRYFQIQVNSSSLDTVQVKPGSFSE